MRLEYKWPYDWKTSLEFGVPEGKCPDPARQEKETVLTGVTVSGKCVPLLARHENSVLAITSPASSREQEEAVKRASERFFFTDYDSKGLFKEMNSDPVLKKIKQEVGAFAPIGFAHTGFEALCKAVIQQQISLSVAIKNACRIVERTGHRKRWDWSHYFSFPSPEDVLNAGPEVLKECGLSRPKAEYLFGLAEYAIENDVEKTITKNPGELLELKGIGEWSVQLVRAAYAHDENAVPYADLGVRTAVGKYFYGGRRASEKECRDFFSRFEHRLGVTVYLLHALRAGL